MIFKGQRRAIREIWVDRGVFRLNFIVDNFQTMKDDSLFDTRRLHIDRYLEIIRGISFLKGVRLRTRYISPYVFARNLIECHLSDRVRFIDVRFTSKKIP